jgi:hypothetical protein
MWRCGLMLGLLGCSGDGADSSVSDSTECGDLDGSGSDTGDLPNILGNWTSTFGNQLDFETCGITGLKPSDMDWIDGSAFSIDGTPPSGLYAEFTRTEGERFYGIESSHGGVVFSGIHTEQGYDMHVSFGGLLFSNELTGRTEVRGHAYMGVDSTGDGVIDCGLQGDFTAFKSGS